MNSANFVSLTRVPLAIFGTYYFITGQYIGALSCLVLAALSDILDGKVAKIFGAHKRGAYFDMCSDLFFEFLYVFTFTFLGDLPWWLGTLILIRICAQTFLLPIHLRLIQSPLSFHRLRRMRISSALTWLVYFFYLFQSVLALEAPPLSKGLEEIILPFILYPMAACLECISIRVLISQYRFTIERLQNPFVVDGDGGQ